MASQHTRWQGSNSRGRFNGGSFGRRGGSSWGRSKSRRGSRRGRRGSGDVRGGRAGGARRTLCQNVSWITGSCICFLFYTPDPDHSADRRLRRYYSALPFSLPGIQLRILGSLTLLPIRAELCRLPFTTITDLYNPWEYPHYLYLDLQSIQIISPYKSTVQPTQNIQQGYCQFGIACTFSDDLSNNYKASN